MSRPFIAMLMSLLGFSLLNTSVNDFRGRLVKMRSSFSDQAPPTVELTTAILDRKYCQASKNVRGSIRFILRLRYTNLGTQPLIFYKASRSITRFTVSISEELAQKEKPEIAATQTMITDGEPLKIDEPTPGTFFAILASKEFYETKTSLTIPIPSQLSSSNYSYASDGKYFLQISVRTWPEEADASSLDLREKWRSFGVLWSTGVTSLPMPFKVDNNPVFEHCQ